MKKLVNGIIKLTERLCSVFKNSIPAYSCRRSKHTYKQYQLAVIWSLMKYLKTNYRGIITQLDLMPDIKEAIGISQLPHFTTINKFFLRINTSAVYFTLVQTAYLFSYKSDIVAIDSTGYSSSHASLYYAQRMHGERATRTYIKASLSVSTANQAVMAVKARLGPRNDNIDFEWLARQSVSIARPVYIVADKGYDSEANHRLVRELHSKPMIPLRIQEGYKSNGSYRKKMLRHFDSRVYHKRSLVETVNSAMKRLMGYWVISKAPDSQCKEVYMT